MDCAKQIYRSELSSQGKVTCRSVLIYTLAAKYKTCIRHMDMQTENLLSLMETCPILNCIEKGEKRVTSTEPQLPQIPVR